MSGCGNKPVIGPHARANDRPADMCSQAKGADRVFL